MPKFFIPFSEDREQAERVWKSTRNLMQRQGFHPTRRQIFRISYIFEGKKRVDEVGKLDRYGNERVVALFENGSYYLCCTENRGVVQGEPILIEKSPETSAVDFA